MVYSHSQPFPVNKIVGREVHHGVRRQIDHADDVYCRGSDLVRFREFGGDGCHGSRDDGAHDGGDGVEANNHPPIFVLHIGWFIRIHL